MHTRRIAMLLAALCCGPPAAGAATGPGGRACSLDAYVTDRDPAGTRVRAAPAVTAPILATLGQRKTDGEAFTAEVHVVAMQDGWARIDRARFADYGAGERALFAGKGWIAGNLLGFTLNAPALRQAPDAGAARVATLAGKDWGPDSAEVLRLIDCRGAFAKLEVKMPDGRHLVGWADRLCSNQVTTCP